MRNSTRHWLQAVILAIAVVLFMGAGDDAARFKDLGHRMMCVCGCGQVLLECNHVGCTYSDKMRGELLAAVDKGGNNNNDDLILQGFVQQYGPAVIAAPTVTGFNRIAWIMPFAALGLCADVPEGRSIALLAPLRSRMVFAFGLVVPMPTLPPLKYVELLLSIWTSVVPPL